MPCWVTGRSATWGTNGLGEQLWTPVPGLAVRIAVLGALKEAVLTLAALGGRAKPDPADPVKLVLPPKLS